MNTLIPSLDACLQAVAVLSWKGVLFALAASVIILPLRRHFSPGWRHLLWLLVLVRFAVPDMGESRWSIMRWFDRDHMIKAQPMEAPAVMSGEELVMADAMEEEGEAHMAVAKPEMMAPQAPAWTLNEKLATVWLTGAVAMLGIMLGLHLRLLWRLRRDHEKPGPRVAEILGHAAALAGMRRPRLWVTGVVRSPAVLGLLRPVILLPREVAEKCDASELKLIFLHEVAHLRRRDLWAQAVASLVVAVHWFNPLAWWAARRMRVEAEMAADALALKYADAAEAHRFGEVLLGFAQRAMAGWLLWSFSATLLGISENKHDLKRRIEALTDVARRRRTRWSLGFLAFALLAFTGLTRSPAQVAAPAAAVPAASDVSASSVVSGVVVDDKGRPVAGASCSLRIGDVEDPEVRKTMSDVAGRFRFEQVPETDALQLRAAHPEYVAAAEPLPRFSSKDQKEHRLVLGTAGSWVTGVVTARADGRPVAGAAVYLGSVFDSDVSLSFLMTGRSRARTDAEGRFRVIRAAYDKDKCALIIDEPGFELRPVIFDWKKGGVALDTVLDAEKLITGKVTDSEGKPVEGAVLTLCSRYFDLRSEGLQPRKSIETGYYSSPAGYWMGELKTDASGAFSSRVIVTEQAQWVVAEHPSAGFQYAKIADWEPGGTLKLDRWAGAQGTLTNEEGVAMPDTEFRLTATRRDGAWDASKQLSISMHAKTRTDARGRYQLERLIPHSTIDFVTVNGKPTSLRRGTFDPGEEKAFDIRIPAARPMHDPVPPEKMRPISGRIVLPGGRSATSSAYRLNVRFRPMGKDGLTDDPEVSGDGRFETKEMPADDYLCTVWVTPKDPKLTFSPNSGLTLAFTLAPDAARAVHNLGDLKLEEYDFAFRAASSITRLNSWPTIKIDAEVENASSYASWSITHGRGAGTAQKFTGSRATGAALVDLGHRFIMQAVKEDGTRHFSAAQQASTDQEAVFEKKVRLMTGMAVKGRLRALPSSYAGDGWIIASVTVRGEVQKDVITRGTPPVAYWYAWSSVARDGRFEFPALPDGSLSLTGFGPGWSTVSSFGSAGSVSVKTAGLPSPIEVTIDTSPTVERRVRLLLPDGKPAAGATLSVLTSGDTSPAFMSRDHAIEPRDTEAYANYKKLRIPGHSVITDAEGRVTLLNQLDQTYGTTSYKVKWTDPQTKEERSGQVSVQNNARQEQEVRIQAK